MRKFMNLEQLKKDVGYRVQLVPIACRLDNLGQPLPEVDDDWIIGEVTDEHVRLSKDTGHFVLLGKDHIHHFTSNPHRSVGTTKFGFLNLLVQIFVQGNDVWVKPTLRPGERVAAPSVKITDKVVNFQYPADSGIQRRLEATGFRLVWSLESELASRVDLHGWEIVVEPDASGHLCRFRCKDPRDDLILLKKRA
jgi:hypothetical protein